MAEPPYKGLRALDISQGIAGPYCAALLAQQGADVIKAEPMAGDWIRSTGGGREGMTAVGIASNLGKRSIALDATKPAGRELLARLAARGRRGAELPPGRHRAPRPRLRRRRGHKPERRLRVH